METIQVWRKDADPSSTTPLGTGKGTYDKKAATATIQTWTDPAALMVDTEYKLKIGRKFYAAVGATRQTTPPVATFRDVE